MSINTNQAFRTDMRRWNNNLFEQADHLPSADRVIPDLPLAERLLSIDIVLIQAYRVRRRQHRPRIPESLNHTMNEYHQDDSTGSIPITPSMVTRYIAQNGYPDNNRSVADPANRSPSNDAQRQHRTNDTKSQENNTQIQPHFIPYMTSDNDTANLRPHKHQMHQSP